MGKRREKLREGEGEGEGEGDREIERRDWRKPRGETGETGKRGEARGESGRRE